MCGIVGFNWDDKNLLKKMMDAVKHRGPDDKGSYVDRGVSLGHQRLSIIDISEKGRQPIFNEDKSIVVVFNGEIYNYKLLRHDLELAGHRFYTDTDTEVIVHLYEEHGVDCVSKLNGMFAFAVYDARSRKLFLARDRVGIKPLYYYFDGEKFVFASEIKAILESGISREVDKTSMAQYFTYGYSVAPRTMFKGVYKLPAASYLILDGKRLHVSPYWGLAFNQIEKSTDVWSRELYYNLKDAVDRRLMSDVPLGAYLSGGVDSSSIVAMMSLLMDRPVNTYSVGFDNKEVVDELSYAKLVASKLGTNHKEIVVTVDDALKSLRKIVWHLDEPINNPGVVPLYCMSHAAKKDMTVVLNGNGGDEVFAGYRQHKFMNYVSGLRHVPLLDKFSGVVRSFGSVMGGRTQKYLDFGAEVVANSKDMAGMYSALMYRNFSSKQLEQLTGLRYEPASAIRGYFSGKGDVLNKVMATDFKTLLAENYLMVDDKVNMANSIESRVPFLDHTLVEFAGTMPGSLKLNLGDGKFLLKRVMKGKIPSEVLNRKKYGFTPPVTSWIDSGVMEYAADTVLKSGMKDYFSNNFARLILKKSTDKRYYNMVFPLLMFGLWGEQYL